MKAYYKFFTSIRKDKVDVEIEVVDVKEKFGRKMCLITPVRGQGKVWVNQDKVIIK